MPQSRPVRRWPHTTVERLASLRVVGLPGQPGQLERETPATVIRFHSKRGEEDALGLRSMGRTPRRRRDRWLFSIQEVPHVQKLLIARNPEADSSLPYIVRIPLGDGIVLRVKDTWPRTAKIYCHPHGEAWPEDADIVEELPLRSCVRRGAAINIEVDRTRESRSQFVITQARGREMIFWQSARTSKVARPNVALPTARASGVTDLEIIVDTRERYVWKFSHTAGRHHQGSPQGWRLRRESRRRVDRGGRAQVTD